MSQIWMQSLHGRVIDMVDPTNNVIDFREIAETLANINRYNGCGHTLQVSVAFHTMICAHNTPEDLIPWVLLHDAHEAYIGDITTPAALALAEVAAERNPNGYALVKTALKDLKHRHDAAIHEAAGLPMPGKKQRDAIHRIDLLALNTERRTFLIPEPQSWGEYIDAAGYQKDRDWATWWVNPEYQAKALLNMFRVYLPALQTKQVICAG